MLGFLGSRQALVAGCLLVAIAAGWYFAPWSADIQSLSPAAIPVKGFVTSDDVFVLRSEEEFRRFAGESATHQSPVVFSQFDLARVTWHADGPGFGVLRQFHRAGGSVIFFSVIANPESYRTFSRRITTDWFVVPKATRIELVSANQVAVRDSLFALPLCVLLVIGWRISTIRSRTARSLRDSAIPESASLAAMAS